MAFHLLTIVASLRTIYIMMKYNKIGSFLLGQNFVGHFNKSI